MAAAIKPKAFAYMAGLLLCAAPAAARRYAVVVGNNHALAGSGYDRLEYADDEGYRVTVQGLSRTFNKEFWNYAILISGMLRQGMPLPQVVDVVANLNLYDATLGTWKNGVVRALQRYIPDGTQARGRKCPECGDAEGLYYEEGCLKCRSCGGTKCG